MRRTPHVRIDSPQGASSRRSCAMSKVGLIVLHDTESHDRDGLSDLEGLLAFFANKANQASSHIIVDAEGNSARCVPDKLKAWTCAGYNSVSLNIEQVGFASFTKTVWSKKRRAQMREVARWIAYWHKKHGIPIQHGKPDGQGGVAARGVVYHSELGRLGGGHSDPGPGYPLGLVLALARQYAKR